MSFFSSLCWSCHASIILAGLVLHLMNFLRTMYGKSASSAHIGSFSPSVSSSLKTG